MIRLAKTYIKLSDHIIEWCGSKASWLTVALVLVICYDVIMRYLFNSSSVAIYEIEWHIFALIFLLGAAYALKHNRHVRVDVLYSRMSEKVQALINLLLTLCFLMPFCWILITQGIDFVSNSFRLAESSPDPGGLPARYLIKAAIPVGFTLLLIQAISVVFQNLLILTQTGHETKAQ